ncbi:MAG: aminoacyl-tRNA hydrolase [Prevotellaceae bacterium]|nr:aminoacyl-tRNA hydrolase [Prevotellaceae bacterium]
MKYLVVGLGNIGVEYANTRHNIGFKALDAFAEVSNVTFSTLRYGALSEVKIKGRSVWLLKPSTYMNLSGKAVAYWLQAEKIPIENMLIIVDDLSLPFGQIRIKTKGSDGGHNGLKNINEIFGHNNYNRLRFGIGHDFLQGGQIDYVLDEWSKEEIKMLPEKFKIIHNAVTSFVTIGIERTMNIFNTKEKPKSENEKNNL